MSAFTKTLPLHYETQYMTRYLLRHPPSAAYEGGTVTTTIGAYLGAYADGGRSHDGLWEWMPLADYWAGAAGVAQDDSKAEELRQRASLIESLKCMNDRGHEMLSAGDAVVGQARACIEILEATK